MFQLQRSVLARNAWFMSNRFYVQFGDTQDVIGGVDNVGGGGDKLMGGLFSRRGGILRRGGNLTARGGYPYGGGYPQTAGG